MATISRPRIGIVANTIDAEYGVRTGGTLHFLEVAKRMTDWDVRIFVPSFAASEVAALAPGATIVSLPSIRRFTARKLPLFAASLALWVARLPELRACDVLYASSHFLGDAIPAIAVRGRRTLVVVHHIIDSPTTRSGGLGRNLIAYVTERLSLGLVRLAGGTLAFDNAVVATELAERGFRNRAIVSGNAVDVPPAHGEIRREHDVAFVGRLSPMKGVDDLLRAWAMVVAAVPDARLRLIGDGAPKYRARLVELCGTLGIGTSVSFLGRVSDADKFAVLRSSSIFAFASKEEGWGIVLAEAMACGVPCVTYDLPAYREVFTRGRRSAPEGDVDAFAAAIVELLTNVPERVRLGAEAADLATGFDWDRVADLEIDAVADLIGAPP